MTAVGAMTIIEVVELTAKLATAAVAALKAGATHVDFDALVAKHRAGEAKDDAEVQAAADAKFGAPVKP